jgi:hypothetical protein
MGQDMRIGLRRLLSEDDLYIAILNPIGIPVGYDVAVYDAIIFLLVFL